ncbi:MAG TPA: response regulator transcription factor [Thermomicrobiales bacterium]|nr:response regulator transcription factor [Thermomicrobiales bacterium]
MEDEASMSALLRQSLTEAGHAVDLAETGEAALAWVDLAHYDAIVLDVMLPDIDGFEVCRRLRRWQTPTPILLLTAKDAVEDRVAGLDAGADDYLVKPFSFAELAARLRALARRPTVPLDAVLTAGELRVNPAEHRVWKGEKELRLTNKEFQILELLMRHAGRVVTRAAIADYGWDYDFPNSANVIDVHVRALRDKLGAARIETVRGVGYRLRVAEADP